jgi:hypothetical protein
MNTNFSTEMNGFRELTAGELGSVAGGNPIVIGAVLGFLADKVLDKTLGNMSIADLIESKTGTLKGVQKPPR